MTTTDAPQTTSDERILAALAHFFGLIAAVIIWIVQKNKSRYVRFQAVQAMSLEILAVWFWVLLVPSVMVLLGIVVGRTTGHLTSDPQRGDFATFALMQLIFWLPPFGAMFVHLALTFIAAIACLMGREFRYPFIGHALARKLGYSPLDPSLFSKEKEDRVVAAVSHAVGISFIAGPVFALAFWLTSKDRSALLRFQSLQAAIYQGMGMVAYMLVSALYVIFAFVAIPLAMLAPQSENSALLVLAIVLVALPAVCFVVVIFVGGPLYLLFCAIASLKVLRGNDYNYPWLGKYLRRRMDQAQPAPEASA